MKFKPKKLSPPKPPKRERLEIGPDDSISESLLLDHLMEKERQNRINRQKTQTTESSKPEQP